MKRNLRRPSRPESIFSAQAFLFVVACSVVALPVHAGIVSSSGVIVSAAPSSVLPGAAVAAQPIIFSEIVGGVAPVGGMPVDHLVTGNVVGAPVVSSSVVNPALVAGTIPQGTAYESYFFHFDPGSAPIGGNYPLADITFSNKILGLQLFSTGDTGLQKPALTPYVGKLEAGDGIAFPAAYYPSGLAARGVESGDSVEVASGGFQLKLSGVAFGGQIDQVRVFVAVPEPASMGMAFVAILGIMGLGGTRSKAARS